MLDVIELIRAKRDGGVLSGEQIRSLVSSYVHDTMPDYQMASFLMASFLQGLSTEETVGLTDAMLHSGEIYSFDDYDHPIVDKHSTGGVGDKISLLLAPLLAALGFYNPMMSGRGLGHTGGTVDKLESIKGYSPELPLDVIKTMLHESGCAMFSQSPAIVPADKKMYALRDATGTVENISLITASIVSKKKAAGIQTIVYDVKCGNGAFMKTREDADALAKSLLAVSRGLGMNPSALVTDMNQVLGYAVGNALEVQEILHMMDGSAVVADVRELTYRLAYAIASHYSQDSWEMFSQKCDNLIASGEVYVRFEKMILRGGGSIDALAYIRKGNFIKKIYEMRSTMSGFVSSMNTFSIGKALIYLGGGRLKKEDSVNHSVGIEMCKKIGEAVHVGDVICRVYFESEEKKDAALPLLFDSITISDTYEKNPLVYTIM